MQLVATALDEYNLHVKIMMNTKIKNITTENTLDRGSENIKYIVRLILITLFSISSSSDMIFVESSSEASSDLHIKKSFNFSNPSKNKSGNVYRFTSPKAGLGSKGGRSLRLS